MFEGFNLACDAVKASLGSEGGLALMWNPTDVLSAPVFSKDGISIAKMLQHKHPEVNMGITLAKQISAKSLVENGDATTTTLVLAQAVLKNTKKTYLDRKGWWFLAKASLSSEYFFNKKVEKGINIACEEVFEQLKNIAKPTSDEDMQKIATVSANNDTFIGKMVAEAYKETDIVGFDRHDKVSTELKISNGMRLSNGWMSPFLVNNQSKAVFDAEDVNIICYEGYLEGDNAISEALDSMQNEPILIIAERFSDDIILKLADLLERRVLNVCAVQCPEYDNKRRALLADIAIYTDGEVFLRGTSTKVFAGKAKKVTVSGNTTVILPEAVTEKTQQRIQELKSQAEDSSEKDFLLKRAQNLQGSSATILVGAVTHEEKNELYDRVEDAVCAVKSAKEEGWVAGGGSTLAYISNKMNQTFENEDVQFGYNCIKNAINSVFKTVCENSRRDYTSYIAAAQKEYGKGYNAHTDEISDLIKDGVIDSARSLRLALSHAASVAKLLMNVKVVISR